MNHNDYLRAVSELSVPMSKADVMRLSNFHKALKNSVTEKAGNHFAKTLAILMQSLHEK